MYTICYTTISDIHKRANSSYRKIFKKVILEAKHIVNADFIEKSGNKCRTARLIIN